MPKQILNVVDFSGGINKAVDKRDIELNELVLSDGLVSYQPGTLTLDGALEHIDGLTENVGAFTDNHISEGIPNLYGLFPELAFRVFGRATCVSTPSGGEAEFLCNNNVMWQDGSLKTGHFHSLDVGASLTVISGPEDTRGTTLTISEIMEERKFKATDATNFSDLDKFFYVLNAKYDANDPLLSSPNTNYQSNRFFLKASQYGKFGFYSIGSDKFWYGNINETASNPLGNDGWFFDTRYLWDWNQDSQNVSNEALISNTRVLNAFSDDGVFRLLLEPPPAYRDGHCKRPVGLYQIDSLRKHFDIDTDYHMYTINQGLYALRTHCLAPHEYHHATDTTNLPADTSQNFNGAGSIKYTASTTTLSAFHTATEDPVGVGYNSADGTDGSNIGSELLPNQFSLGVSTSGTGDWQCESGSEHSTLGFSISLLYDDMEDSSESNLSLTQTHASTISTSVTINSSNDVSLYLYMKCYIGMNEFNAGQIDFLSVGVNQSNDITQAVSEFRGSRMNNGFSNFKCWNPRIVGAKVYLSANFDGELDKPLYLAKFNFDGNADNINASASHDGNKATENWKFTASENQVVHQMIINKTVPVLPYDLINGYKHNENIHAWYKTSAIINRRLYAGNVSYFGVKNSNSIDSDEAPMHFPDRILRSPVNKFDILPASSGIDLILHDSQDIVKLLEFGQKLLIFKNDDLYILDCSGEIEFLEATHKGMGLALQTHVCVTPNAVYWVNNHGVFGFDNENPPGNLIKDKISVAEWTDKIYNIKMHLEYEPKDNLLLIFGRYQAISPSEDISNKQLFILNLNTGSVFFKSQPCTTIINSYSKGLLFNNNLYISGQFSSGNERFSSNKTTAGVIGASAYGIVSFSINNADYSNVWSLGGTHNKYLWIRIGSTWTVVNGNWTLSQWDSSSISFNYPEQVLNANNATNSDYTHRMDYNESLGKVIAQVTADKIGTAYTLSPTTISGYGNSFYGWSNTNSDEPSALGDIENFSTIFNKAGVNNVMPIFTVFADRLNQNLVGSSYSIILTNTASTTGDPDTLYYSANYVTSYSPGSYYTAAASSAYSNDSDASANNLTNSNALTTNLHEFLQNNPFDQDPNQTFADYFDFSSVSTDDGSGTVTGTAGMKYFTMTAKDISQTLVQCNLEATVDSGVGYQLLKWNGNVQNETNQVLLETKDYDFDQPNVRKKIYKAYITYKASSGIKVYYQANQSGTWTLATVVDSTTDNTLLTSTEYTRGEIKFGSGGNNIYSFALKFQSTNIVKTFDINDISFVFRPKRPK